MQPGQGALILISFFFLFKFEICITLETALPTEPWGEIFELSVYFGEQIMPDVSVW